MTPTIPWKVWKTITVGTITEDQFGRELSNRHIHTNNMTYDFLRAALILSLPGLVGRINLVVMSVRELGFDEAARGEIYQRVEKEFAPGTQRQRPYDAGLSYFLDAAYYSEICRRAQKIGLELCPGDAGLQLRLQYLDQPRGERLHMAMEPIIDANGGSHIFSVGKFQSGSDLYAEPFTSIYPDSLFVFRAP